MKAPSERHLEDWIIANKPNFKPQPLNYDGIDLSPIDTQGGYLNHITLRQPILSSGKPDLIGFNGDTLVVVELKKNRVDEKTIMQLNRYIVELQSIAMYLETQLIEGWVNKPPVNIDRYIKGIAVGYGEPKRNVLWSMPHYIQSVSYEYANEQYLFYDNTIENDYNWIDTNDFVNSVGKCTSVLNVVSAIVRTAHADAENETSS